MKIPVTLNEEKIIIDESPDTFLRESLRNSGILSIKEGCEKGRCGSCTVLLDGKPVSSCILPTAIVKDCKIITLEHFIKTKDGQDIQKGFATAGINLCGFCNASRYFSTYALLNKSYKPTQEELEETANSIECSCIDKKNFIAGILYATANKHEREGRKNVLI
ncbi:MAG: 2Fe-2S iron-sulfur cluster binding domain-containing protein [Treponema sp.]|nr:2Fe-2S iron-sulfur cluster binding domain-containing protein [Candidatus Treponema equifaecale]